MSKNTKTNTVSRTAVRNKLRKGETNTIADKTGYSVSHVSNVLAGRRNNSDIMKVATTLTSRRK
jgi:hypothetical protein